MVEAWQVLAGLGLTTLAGIGVYSIARKPGVGPGVMPTICKDYVEFRRQTGAWNVYELLYADNRTDPPHQGQLLITDDARIYRASPDIYNPNEAVRYGLLNLAVSNAITMAQYNRAVNLIKSQFPAWSYP